MTNLSPVNGKIPPQATDLEEVVLGGLMLERDKIDEVMGILTADFFYSEKHQHIFEAIKQLYNENKAIDILTVTNQLRTNNKLDLAGGAYSVAHLTSRVSSAANINYHVRILNEKYILRQIISLSGFAASAAYSEGADAFDVLGALETNLEALKPKSSQPIMFYQKLLHDGHAAAVKTFEQNIEPGITTGFSAIDKAIGFFQPGELIFIGARPGMGKTALALSMALSQAKRGINGLFFSIEMSAEQIRQRLIAMECEIDTYRIRTGRLMEDEIKTIEAATWTSLPLVFDFTPALTPQQLKSAARLHKRKNGDKLDIIYVDYLGLMKSGKKTKDIYAEVSEISSTFKPLAKELNCTVVVLAQLSREVEKRTGKMPQLSDLRDSGTIEQDGDQIWFPFRPEMYAEHDASGESNAGRAEIIVAKNRNGSTDIIELNYQKEFTKFQ